MPRVTKRQKEKLYAILVDHPEMIHSRTSNNFTKEMSDSLWQEASTTLNGLGPQKDWRHWKTCWRDLKSALKKASAVRNHANATRGGPPSVRQFSRAEESLVSLIKEVSVYGEPTGEESAVAWTSGNSTSSVDNDIAPSTPLSPRVRRESRNSRHSDASSREFDAGQDDIKEFLEEATATQRTNTEEERVFRNDVREELRSMRQLLEQMLQVQRQLLQK